ncbi:MAG TPA: tetratricopeptide repeat protein [Pseudonocardiaceae bacterium]|nr:tetratricopeptide repeat protein [Pseudonocardiaceae bacterium]
MPADVSKVLLLDPLPHSLLAALVEHNRNAGLAERIRLRVAVHAGEVARDDYGLVGNDVVIACRLLDATELRTALANADVPVAFIVSDTVYEAIVRHRYRGIDAGAYHPVSVRVKRTRLHAWLHLPGSTAQPAFDTPGGQPEDKSPPRQLPPAPPMFVGRGDELGLLDECAADTRLLVVVGVPGVGKTTLAVHWAHAVRDHYPDGQLYSDLGGVGNPVPVEQVLAQFLRALGVPPASVPVDTVELSALFRSLTSNRRLLVLLDNVPTAAPVRMLQPASGLSMTVVTSRSVLGGLVADGARVVGVDPLSVADGVELLDRLIGDERIGREPDWARTLAAQCAGLPIALCVVGARLVAHRRWPVQRVVTELRDEQRRLARLSMSDDLSVQAVFDMSYQALSPSGARLYRLLGLHPGPDFEPALAAAALATPVSEAESLLEELQTASLVEETTANRCRLHALIGLHARQQAESVETEEERALVLRRMVDWYLHSATVAGTVVTPHRTDVRRDFTEPPVQPIEFDGYTDALEWLDRERVNLLAAAKAAADRGWHESVWQLADAMWGLFLYRAHYYDWLQFDLLAVRATQDCADRIAEAGAHDRLGLMYHAVGRNDEALQHLAHAADIWRELGDQHRITSSLERFGFAYLDQGRMTLALDHFERALSGYRALGQPRSIGLALVSVGRALTKADRAEDAMQPLTEAVSVLAGLTPPDDYNVARARIALGRVEVLTDRYDSARDHLESALRTMRAVNIPIGEADAFFALGELYESSGDTERARECYTRTEEIFTTVGNPGVDGVRERIRAL